MSEIKVLDYNLINKIAAGEVVERPSSIVKELVENSIDAGAKVITIEIKDGGISLIRITDNGCGIPKSDIKQAFLRHATSKLSQLEDLDSLITLGFRGEALSSIASIAQVELVTKTSIDITGTHIEIHGGEFISEQNIGCSDGTTLIVRNIFFNTPARRKFLKKAATESGYISEIITKLALGHPEISFKYINNDSILIQTNGNGDLKTAIFNIYGKDVAQKIIKLEHKENGYTLEGYIGKPELSRANRNYENFFINGRFIKSSLMSSAVEEAYKTRLMVGKFPLFVLNLITEPFNVDVNVHPTKLEVRFSDEDFIYNFIEKAVEKTFKPEILIAKVELTEPKPQKFSQINNSEIFKAETFSLDKPLIFNDNKETYVTDAPVDKSNDWGEGVMVNVINIEMPVEVEPEIVKPTKTEEKPKPKPFFHNYKIVGQIFNTYWIVEQDNIMYMIDQHAAHEKILYESIMEKKRTSEITSQRLLSPQALNLNQNEYLVAKDNWDLLQDFGFEIEEFGDKTIAVRAVPYIFSKPADSNFFMDIIDMLSSAETSIDNIYDTKIDAIATISCKAAVKGNDRLDYIEAKSLIEDVLKLENPFSCPHGRPTIVEISRLEVEKKFKRVL